MALIALFESSFSIDWVVELTGKRASQILSVLEEGVRQGLLTRTEHGNYCFVNQKKQKELSGHLTAEEIEKWHARIAEFLLRELPGNDLKPQILTPYLLHISNHEEGCRWLIQAGELNLKTFRPGEALQCYTKILHDLSGLESEEADSLFTQAAIQYSKISTARHDSTSVLSVLQGAMDRARKWNNTTCEALLEMHLAKNEWLRSRYDSAMKHFERGFSMAQEIDDPKLHRSANTFSTFFLYWQGRFRDAVRGYEKSVPDVEKYPKGGFPLLAALTVGHCYAQIGQISQGLGMMDSIRIHAKERGDFYLAAHAGVMIGGAMVDLGRTDDALPYLECSIKEAAKEQNEWAQILGRLMLAFTYFLKEDYKRCVILLHEFLDYTKEVHVIVQPYPYLMELSWAMEQGTLPVIPGLSLKKDVFQQLKGKNIFMKGIALRYHALLQKREGLSHQAVIRSLSLSCKLLEESGHQIELAKSQLELAREYLLTGDEVRAKEITLSASGILSSLNESLIPNDLRPLIKYPIFGKNPLKEILKLGQEVVTIRDNRDLVQHVISTVNRITGAERGAIFLVNDNTSPPSLQLRASKNLMSGQINHPSFGSSMRMIEEVARTGKGLILGRDSIEDFNKGISKEAIHSRICVPMILQNKVVGVLYHDNRLLSSAFKESDLELLAYFAALAAIAFDNVSAYGEVQRLNQKLKAEKQYYEEQYLHSYHFEEIVGESTAIKRVLEKVEQVAKTDTTVLILGETGVGKELIARAIHRKSRRCEKPFISVNCSSLPDTLIPSELFGHEKGSFTGATHRRIGRFELADGGTLFLDEISDISPDVQVRLLRVLQTKEFERVGGNETLLSDFRLIAATNQNIKQEVKASKFRSDLYYRINVFPIRIPALREKKEDIPLLAHYFLQFYSAKMGKTFDRISDVEMDKLIEYNWWGNVRELQNIIERGTILSPGPYFLAPELEGDSIESMPPKRETSLKENERSHILAALQKTGWKVRGIGGAAELLEIHPSTLAFKMKKLGIRRPKDIPRLYHRNIL